MAPYILWMPKNSVKKRKEVIVLLKTLQGRKLLISLIVVTMIMGSFGGIFAFADSSTATKITIFHTNDVHGRIEGSSSEIGYAKIAGYINAFRAENPNVLVLDAGDTFHGLSIATLQRGESVVKAMNALQYDALVPGNHDFNYGYQRLLELEELSNFPIISANVKTEAQESLLTDYIIKEVDGVTIGIFGLSTPETVVKTNPKNVEGLTFEDPSLIAATMVSQLKDRGVDVIIALGHLGIDSESVDTSYKVIDEVEGIDVFIDGHSHTAFENGKVIKNTLLASTGEYSKNLGVVEITVQDGKIVEKTAALLNRETFNEIEADEELQNLIGKISEEQQKVLSEVIGETKVRLDGERELSRKQETNLGNLTGDIFLHWTNADVALVNGGGIRASIEAGKITKGDIVTVFPFGNVLFVKKVSGAALKEALEHGTKSYPDLAGGFPHVAGMTYAIDLARPVGDRVVDITVKGEALDLNKQYILATNDFLAAGGDGYTMIKDGEFVQEMMTMDEAIVQYIQEVKVIEPQVEGRIVVKPAPVEETAPDEDVNPVEPKPVEKANITYIVQPGDWLSKIAIKYNTTWQKLQTVNSIKNADLIFPGQVILIPAQ